MTLSNPLMDAPVTFTPKVRVSTPADLASVVRSQKLSRSSGRWRAVWVCGLAAARKKRGLTLQDVADATGVSTTTVLRMETGANPVFLNAWKLAKFYGSRIETLWPSLLADCDITAGDVTKGNR